ncbi:hypothetical protein, partial [Vibrio chagasii]|uniref:hypothetical protein n=1 Tax=Vibrio chagasii TaxID=170679 RepID=UPI002283C881
ITAWAFLRLNDYVRPSVEEFRKRFARCPQPRPFRHLSESLVLRLGFRRFWGIGILVFDQRVPVACDPSYSATYTKLKHNCLGFFTFE